MGDCWWSTNGDVSNVCILGINSCKDVLPHASRQEIDIYHCLCKYTFHLLDDGSLQKGGMVKAERTLSAINSLIVPAFDALAF